MSVTSLAARRREIESLGSTELSDALASELRTLALQLDSRTFPRWMVAQLAHVFAPVFRVCSHYLGERESGDDVPLGERHQAVLASIEARPILTPVLPRSESDRVWLFFVGLLIGGGICGTAVWIADRSLAAVGLLP